MKMWDFLFARISHSKIDKNMPSQKNKWEKFQLERDFCLITGSLSEEQFVHDPEVEHGALSAPSRISHDRESGGVY